MFGKIEWVCILNVKWFVIIVVITKMKKILTCLHLKKCEAMDGELANWFSVPSVLNLYEISRW